MQDQQHKHVSSTYTISASNTASTQIPGNLPSSNPFPNQARILPNPPPIDPFPYCPASRKSLSVCSLNDSTGSLNTTTGSHPTKQDFDENTLYLSNLSASHKISMKDFLTLQNPSPMALVNLARVATPGVTDVLKKPLPFSWTSKKLTTLSGRTDFAINFTLLASQVL